MTTQLSDAVRNAMLEAMELTMNGQALSAGTGAGASVTGTAAPPMLQFWSGSKPANCAASATGTKLAEFALPADWMTASGATTQGVKDMTGTWQGTGLVAAGSGTSIGYYRLVNAAGNACHEQGTVTASGGGGDMTVDNVSLAYGQTVKVLTKTLTAPNA